MRGPNKTTSKALSWSFCLWLRSIIFKWDIMKACSLTAILLMIKTKCYLFHKLYSKPVYGKKYINSISHSYIVMQLEWEIQYNDSSAIKNKISACGKWRTSNNFLFFSFWNNHEINTFDIVIVVYLQTCDNNSLKYMQYSNLVVMVENRGSADSFWCISLQ